MISDLIRKIESSGNENFSIIKSPKLLIKALVELDSMIGMDDAKKTVVEQIQLMVINKYRKKSKDKMDKHMLHSLIIGPPGVGKTTLGLILAKIVSSLGIFEKPKETVPETVPLMARRLITLDDKLKRTEGRINKVKDLSKQLKQICFTGKQTLTKLRRSPDFNRTVYSTTLSSYKEIQSKCIEIIKECDPEVIKLKTEEEDEKIIFVVAGRADLCGTFIGETAVKTKKILDSAMGGVLFIDEAYSLVNEANSRDFGNESLHQINEYMSKYSDSFMVIFAGYKEKIEKTLFEAQPGLKRRISHTYEIKEYNEKDLAKIFRKQIEEDNWKIDEKINLEDFFYRNKSYFPNFGGDTLRLVLYCKLAFSKLNFESCIEGKEVGDIIDEEVLERAFLTLLAGNDQDPMKGVEHMYL